MLSPFTRVKPTVVLVGLTLALVVSGALPLLGGYEAEAARNNRRAKNSNEVTAEAVQSFANPDGIAIPAQGTATTYPSTIQVSGFQTPIANVAVTLHRFSHTAPEDVDVLLVGPAGQSAIIMSDVGGLNPATLLTFTLHDQAASPLPQGTALSSGSFQPTNAPGSDPFPAPAPTPGGGSSLSVFNGTDPNGTWQLFVNDNGAGNSGAFNDGWSLLITTANGVPKAKADSFQA